MALVSSLVRMIISKLCPVPQADVLAGEQFIDTVTLGDLVIENQGIGASFFAIGFNGVEGILGYVQ